MLKNKKIPTIFGVILLLASIAAGVFFLQFNQVFKIGADASLEPNDVRLSNISDNSATISWMTAKEAAGFASLGESESSLGRVEKESASDEKFFTHSITLSGLKPQTTYFFKINSGGSNFDNNGLPWKFTTGTALSQTGSSNLISGSIISASGQPQKRALVYANVGGYLLSTLSSETGNFIFQLSAVRSQDLKSFQQIDPAGSAITISVQASSGEVSSATVFTQSAKPMPAMILGQTHDFRNLEASPDGLTPDASLALPEDATRESKFSVTDAGQTPAPSSVILESITDGETVTSTKPAFFGRGPGGEEITITVESENPITESVSIKGDGTWTWSPPTDLAPGAHTVTLLWVDASGITRKLIRNFVVQAGEAPAFEASGSATTQTPAPTATATPTPRPTATATASAEPIPETGSLTSTIALSMMGIAVMLFSFFVWKMAER